MYYGTWNMCIWGVYLSEQMQNQVLSSLHCGHTERQSKPKWDSGGFYARCSLLLIWLARQLLWGLFFSAGIFVTTPVTNNYSVVQQHFGQVVSSQTETRNILVVLLVPRWLVFNPLLSWQFNTWFWLYCQQEHFLHKYRPKVWTHLLCHGYLHCRF